MMRKGGKYIAVLVLAASASLLLAQQAGDPAWRGRVPQKERTRMNPLAEEGDAALAGARLYGKYCAQCHGDDAKGSEDKPSLRSGRIRNATAGELQWLLANGNLKKGMPSWSRLPEPQRWQIVAYLKSLQSPPRQE